MGGLGREGGVGERVEMGFVLLVVIGVGIAV